MKLATSTGDFICFQNRLDSYSANSEALVLLAECGFKYVDLNFYGTINEGGPIATDGWREWAMDLKKTAERLGLVFVQAHSTDSVFEKGETRDRLTGYIKRQIEVCHILGIPGMVVHGLNRKDSDLDEFLRLNVEFYSELLMTAREFDVCIYTENTCKKNCPTYFTLEALSIPSPARLLGRHKLVKNDITYDKLNDLPMEFKLRSERLLHDIAVYMLKAYDCYEE